MANPGVAADAGVESPSEIEQMHAMLIQCDFLVLLSIVDREQIEINSLSHANSGQLDIKISL